MSNSSLLYYVDFSANTVAAFFANVTLFTHLFNVSTFARNIPCGIAASKSAIISPDCIILDNLVFENFILSDEQFAKVLRFF